MTLPGPHRKPVQARARATFQKILDVAVEILSEDGVTALNTNKVAERANVNIATLYSYFPNKEAIIVYLAHKFEDTRATSVEQHAPELGVGPNWEQWFIDNIESMVQFRLEEPGGLAVRQALMASPDLHELDLMSTRRAVEAKIPGLMRLNPDLTEQTARLISRVCTVAITAVLDDAFKETPYDRSAIEELKRIVIAYYAIHLPPSHSK